MRVQHCIRRTRFARASHTRVPRPLPDRQFQPVFPRRDVGARPPAQGPIYPFNQSCYCHASFIDCHIIVMRSP